MSHRPYVNVASWKHLASMKPRKPKLDDVDEEEARSNIYPIKER